MPAFIVGQGLMSHTKGGTEPHLRIATCFAPSGDSLTEGFVEVVFVRLHGEPDTGEIGRNKGMCHEDTIGFCRSLDSTGYYSRIKLNDLQIST